MKKNLLLLFTISFCCTIFAQTTPCTNEIILAKKAKWKYAGKTPLTNSEYAPKTLAPEFIKRIDALHNLVLEAFPEGVGTEPWWSRFLGSASDDKTVPYTFFYKSGYPFYYCSQDFPGNSDANSNIIKCYCQEYGTLLTISANKLTNDLISGSQESFEINGNTVYKMAGYVGKWKGYEVYNLYGNSAFAERVVVIHRKGMLPFHYVTRKEFLLYRIAFFEKFKKDMGNDPSTNQAMDEEIKKHKDELNRTHDSLLNSPAILGGSVPGKINDNDRSAFFYETGNGTYFLAKESPGYFRKDLPRYIPQYFILHWQWFGYDSNTNRKHLAAPEYFAEQIEKKFPIEKLQAMIDK